MLQEERLVNYSSGTATGSPSSSSSSATTPPPTAVAAAVETTANNHNNSAATTTTNTTTATQTLRNHHHHHQFLPSSTTAQILIRHLNGFNNYHEYPNSLNNIQNLHYQQQLSNSSSGSDYNSDSSSSSGEDITDNKTDLTNMLNNSAAAATNHDQRSTTINEEIMNNELERLKTFRNSNWTNNYLDINLLAKIGIYYTGHTDRTKCYFCSVIIGRWEINDNPLTEHIRWSPNCPLLKRRITNNIPIDVDSLDRILPPITYDVCGFNDIIEVRPAAYAEGTISSSASGDGDLTPDYHDRIMNSNDHINNFMHSPSPSSVNITPFQYPDHPEFSIESARIRSYIDRWPKTMKQKPEQLSEAGFFYTGIGDRVKCFSCGGGLKDWDITDDPWEQHALWLSNCRYLKLIKGICYIEQIKNKYQNSTFNKVVNQHNNDECQINVTPVASSTTTTTNTTVSKEPQQHTTTSNHEIVVSNNTTIPNTTSTNNTTTTTNNIQQELQNIHTTTTIQTPNHNKLTNHNHNHNNNNNMNINMNNCCNSNISSKCINQILCNENDEQKSTAAAATTAMISEEKLCKICYAGEYNTAFLPCGHVVACAKCASSVTKCPMCRKPFTDVMRVYFS